MIALTLTQPWASLIAAGEKRVETRSWCPSPRVLYGYPGRPLAGGETRLAIHAAKGLAPVGGRRGLEQLCGTEPFRGALIRAGNADATMLPLGAIVAVCRVEEIVRTETYEGGYIAGTLPGARHELEFGDYTSGRFAWVLADVQRLDPPVTHPRLRGRLGIWPVPPIVWNQIEAQGHPMPQEIPMPQENGQPG